MAVGSGFQGKMLEDVLRAFGGVAGIGLCLLAREFTQTLQPTDVGCPFPLFTAPSPKPWPLLKQRGEEISEGLLCCPEPHPWCPGSLLQTVPQIMRW
jgi:hypothetical protein